MDSILKIIFRQTENLLQLTKSSINIYQIQNILANDNINLFDKKINHHCSFSYDLCNELQILQKHLHSTCFLLQQALYRVQALRKIHGNLPIRIHDNIIIKYEENLSLKLNNIQQMILSTINEYNLIDSPLNTLYELFKEIQENFEIFLDYIYSMPVHKSTIYIGHLISNTLEKFYLILGSLARFIMSIEEFEIK